MERGRRTTAKHWVAVEFALAAVHTEACAVRPKEWWADLAVLLATSSDSTSV